MKNYIDDNRSEGGLVLREPVAGEIGLMVDTVEGCPSEEVPE